MSTKARFNKKLPKYGFGNSSTGGVDFGQLFGGAMGVLGQEDKNTDAAYVENGASMGAKMGSSFGPIGSAIGTVGGEVYGLIDMVKNGKAAHNARQVQSMNQGKMLLDRDRNLLQGYATNGNGYVSAYAKGGKLRTRGEDELTNYTPQEFGTRSAHEMYISPYAVLRKFFPRTRRYARGGKVEPIYTNNPNDPRLQAYNDSLYNYNTNQAWVDAKLNADSIRGSIIYNNIPPKQLSQKGIEKPIYSVHTTNSKGQNNMTYNIFPKPEQKIILKQDSIKKSFIHPNYFHVDFPNQDQQGTDRRYFDKITGKPYDILANGGQLELEDGANTHPTLGGKLLPLNDEASLVVGDNHNQDSDNDGNEGVTMINPETGQPYAEVENGEVVTSNNDVISDRIKLPDGRTVAEAFIPLQTEEGKIKKKIQSGGNIYKVNHYKRDLQEIQRQEQELLDYSEDMRQQYAKMPNAKMAMGGRLKKYALGEDNIYNGQSSLDLNNNSFYNWDYNQSSPNLSVQNDSNNQSSAIKPNPTGSYITDNIGAGIGTAVGTASGFMSNIYNAIANSKSKPLPSPIGYKAASLRTSYNVNPQINQVNQEQAANNKLIDYNTSSSAVARTNKLANSARSIQQKNQILANKENIENQLANQSAMNNQQIGNANIDLANQNKKDIWNFEKYKTDETSKNIANVEDKLQTIDVTNRQNQLDYDKIATDLQGKSPDTYAKMMGTGAFDKAVRNNNQLKKTLFDYVSKQGNEELYNKFVSLYGKF